MFRPAAYPPDRDNLPREGRRQTSLPAAPEAASGGAPEPRPPSGGVAPGVESRPMDGTVILVTRRGLGRTRPEDEPFGVEMLDKFFHTLEKLPEKPTAILFYTEGVRCVVEDSPLVLGLKLLEGMGVRLVSCQTCLKYYGLDGKVAAGGTGGMDEIVRLMGEARKVITV